jgi:hypothetical protein
MGIFSRIFRLSDKFFANFPRKIMSFGDHTVAVGVLANGNTVIGVNTVAGVPVVAVLLLLLKSVLL